MIFSLIAFFACETDPNVLHPLDEVNAQELEGEALLHPIPSSWDFYNDPVLFNSDYTYEFHDLPLAGKLSKEPWSGYYWPKNKGGIAYRWQTNEQHTYAFLDKETVLSLEAAEIAKLSPAEKYDLLVGNYNYPLTYRILAENSVNESAWSGICHGWSPASDAYEEPRSVFLTNDDGVKIPFGSSDVKALLSYYRAEVVRSPYPQHEWRTENTTLGSVCLSNNPTHPNCYDTNPGAFHVVMTNQIGILNEGFNLDVDTKYEKWNQPAYAYTSTLIAEQAPSANSSAGTTRELVVQTDLEYVLEIEPQWVPSIGTSEQSTKVETYLYTLELDSHGRIIGGQWLVENNHSYISLADAYNWLITADQNNDGVNDYSEEEAISIIWDNFRFPDYLWLQKDVGFPEEFVPLSSYYDLITTTTTSRQKLYDYFGEIERIYEASLE